MYRGISFFDHELAVAALSAGAAGAARVRRCTCSRSRYFHFRQSAPRPSAVGRHDQEGTGASGLETRGDRRPEVGPYAEETA